MITTSKERTKKYRENKRLRELNQQIKEKDILRGEKLSSKREEVILRENLKLNGNETKSRYKAYISKLIRHYYNDTQSCYFFTLCYRFGDQTGHIANASIIANLKEELVNAGAIDSMIIIPEYHKTRSAVHNHGIICVAQTYKGDIEALLKGLWVDRYSGSLHVTSLDASKLFENYLTKFVRADESRLYNFCDGLLTEGIDYNAIPELKVTKPSLLPVNSIPSYSIVEASNVTTFPCEHPLSITKNFELINHEPDTIGVEYFEPSIQEAMKAFVNNGIPLKIQPLQKLLQKLYYWYSVIVIMYLNYMVR